MKWSSGLLVPAVVGLVAMSSQAATITNTYYVTATGFQRDGEVLARFTQAPGAAQGTCLPSVEVYDQVTGTTQVVIPSEANPGPSQ